VITLNNAPNNNIIPIKDIPQMALVANASKYSGNNPAINRPIVRIVQIDQAGLPRKITPSIVATLAAIIMGFALTPIRPKTSANRIDASVKITWDFPVLPEFFV
jgi:hypothetical protein